MTAWSRPLGDVEAGLRCDATGCFHEVTRVAANGYRAYGQAEAEAKADGWSAWAGRSARHYCPNHAPQPGHKMRHIWGPAS